jgi:hypothetical protein
MTISEYAEAVRLFVEEIAESRGAGVKSIEPGTETR